MGVVRGVARPTKDKLAHKPRPLRKSIASGVAQQGKGAEGKHMKGDRVF